MKKNFLGIFALSTCLLLSAAGCEKKPTTPSYNVQSAANYIKEQYLNTSKESRVDYELPAYIDLGGVKYDITWTAVAYPSGEAINDVTVRVEGDKAIIDLNQEASEEQKYELKGVVKAPDNTTAEVNLLRTLLAAPTKVTSKITAAPQEGVTYQYHVYQSTLGKDLYFAGKMSGQYYFQTTEDFEDAINVYVEYVENSTELFNIYFYEGNDKTNSKQYIGAYVSGTHYNVKFDTNPVSQFKWDPDLQTITTTVSDETVCYLGNYSTFATIQASKISYAETSNVGHLVTLVNRDTVSAEDRVLDTKKELKVTAAYIGDATVELQTAGLKFPDVKVDWAVTSNNATYSNGVLTLTAPTANTPVTLTATIKSGDGTATDTANFTIKSVKNDTASILAAAFELESGESFGNEATLTGVVNAINVAYDPTSKYGDIEATFVVEGKAIFCYDMVGSSSADIQAVAAGDTITVTGTLTNYNGMIQFGRGCEASDLVDGTAPKTDITIEEALAFPVLKDTTEKYTTTGTIKSIAVEKNEDGSVKRTNVYIVDEDENELYIYGIDAGEYTLAVGDTITVNGVLSVYNKVNQFKNATVTAWESGVVEPEVEYVIEKITSAPEEGVAYKYYVYQSSVEKDCYFTGKMSGYFFAVSEKVSEGVDLYVEYVEDSTELFNIYFLDSENVRQYIGVKVIVIDGANKDRPAIATTPVSQFKWNAEKGIITTTITAANGSEAEFYIGNYSDFETLSASKISYAGESGNNIGALVKVAVLDNTYKVNAEKEALTLTDEVTGATEIDLPATGTTYTDVVITWKVDDTNAAIATIANGKLTIAKVDTEITVKVTATLTIGEGETAVTETKVFEITAKVPAATAEEKLAAEKEALTLETTAVSADTEITLPTTPAKYTDVVISWALTETNAYATLADNKLTIMASAATEIKLTATLAIGEEKVTKEFAINVTSTLPVMQEQTAYKMYLNQVRLGKTLYVDGGVSTRYLTTTEYAVVGANVYAERVFGGYKFYILGEENAKLYINMYLNSSNQTSVNYASETSSVYSYAVDTNCWYASFNNSTYYLGTYDNYNTISISKTSYISSSNTGVSQFPANFVLSSEVETDQAKADYQASLINVETTSVTEAGTVTLDTAENLTWALAENTDPTIATLNGNIITFALPAIDTANVEVTVIATVTVGEATATKEFNITVVAPKTPSEDGEPTTVSVVIADYADTNSWTNSKQYPTITVDENITVTATGSSNTGKYYTSGENWRIYQNESPSVTIKATEGKTIVSVKISYIIEKTGVLTQGETQIASDTVVSVNANSITFGVGNTDSTVTNGQVRITAIEVIYQ